MAKRKRLSAANPMFLTGDDASAPSSRPPIAGVASDAAALAALEEMSDTMSRARTEGRMIVALPLEQIQLDYLVRDRLSSDSDEMTALMESLRARGQQAPVELVALEGDKYGLISGWRRCRALKQLASEGHGDGTVLAILRRPAEASDAYLAMVEENEIRVGLSYFERAHIAVKTVEQGVFETNRDALRALFGSASRARRSKIGSFMALVTDLGTHLRFPEAIGERLGLSLARRLDEDQSFAKTLCETLEKEKPETIEAEQSLLSSALTEKAAVAAPVAKAPAQPRAVKREIAPGLWMRSHPEGPIELSGEALTPEKRDRIVQLLEADFGAGQD